MTSTKHRRKLISWIVGIIIIIILLVSFPEFFVDLLWHKGLGYEQVFWKIKLTQFALFIAAFIVSLTYVWINMSILSKNISSFFLNFQGTSWEHFDQVHFNTKQIRRFLYVLGGFISFIFAGSYYAKWDDWFRFFNTQSFSRTEPIFGHDVGFYTLQLPFIETIQGSLVSLVFIVLLISIFFYVVRRLISIQSLRQKTSGPASRALRHISINLGIWFLLLAFGYFLDRYHILYDDHGAVFGAGYTDIHARLPVLWVMVILSLLTAGICFYQIHRKKTRWLLISIAGILLVGILGRGILPSTVQSLAVKPNELKLEEPYLENNIASTRAAYGLDKFHETSYDASDTLTYNNITKNMQILDNVRLWDPRPIIQTYRQLQEIRLYYSFPIVSVDRYRTKDDYKQVMISPRELNTSKLPPKSQTWVNRHLQYTHGYGVTMSPVAKTNEEGGPELLIKDLPPVTNIDIPFKKPAIYYGLKNTNYKLVNTQVKELDYPKGKDNVYTHYDGHGGITIDNFAKKALYSLYFGDFNLLLTEYIKSGSRIQYWQNIQQRIQQIAPFLQLSDPPYLVISEGKLYWMQDAYTRASNYPYSETYDGKHNYIRNSVKIVVDAYQGDVDFYVADEEDPLLKVYQDIFPDMFKPIDDMPGTLKEHVRYPEHLFKIQMALYSKYHMTNPQTFYNNEDLWDRPNSKYAGNQIKMESYYILSKLPKENKLKYLLISPLTPHRRDNMISWMAAESDYPNYGQVHVYELPKSRLFLGPAQIEAKIDQNTEISRQLSLWDQRGSGVIRGNLMVIPIEDSFIYVEPVFLIAQGVNIPQLKRVIVTMGNKVVMERTLHEAINALFNKQINLPIDIISPLIPPVAPAVNSGVQVQNVSPKLESIKTSWEDLQDALKKQQWKEFGVQMEKIDSLLEKD